MRCKVKDCNSRQNGEGGFISFHRFPSDKGMLKKWKNFCRRQEIFDPSKSNICSKHFTPMDFENNLQFEMGKY